MGTLRRSAQLYGRRGRRWWAGAWVLAWVLVLGLDHGVAGAAAEAQQPAVTAELASPPAAAADDILDRMSRQEVALYSRMREMAPRVETYLQNTREDPVLGDVPVADRYYLGILHFDGGYRSTSFLSEPEPAWRRRLGPIDDLLLSPLRLVLGLDVDRNSFTGMLFPDGEHFDREHYRFEYIRREFLGQVRCYVFDVAPLNPGAKGSFWGRIWIEDQDDTLVRFNGSFWQNRYGFPDLHFDSWRGNVRPGVWVPIYVYAEESHMGYGLFRHARYEAQTRLWGYDLRLAGHQQELTSMSVEGADIAPQAPPTALSPLGSLRSWERQAEDNVLDRLEHAGLLAPPGPVDDVLATVANNLVLTNQLTINPPVRCRVLLTTPIESLTIGHTIVLSRGLIDSLPDEASLAAMLAHELAHIALGQRLDTRYAFADRMLFADQDSFHLLDLRRTPQEEAEANVLAVKLLAESPYAHQLAAAGLYLRQVDARRAQTPHLLSTHLGNAWFAHNPWGSDYLDRLTALESAAPKLAPAEVKQTAALPLGGRLSVDPWTGAVSMTTPQAATLLSARDKMPLQLTPMLPYLQRATAAGAASDTSSKGNDPPPVGH